MKKPSHTISSKVSCNESLIVISIITHIFQYTMRIPHPFPYQGSKRNLSSDILEFIPDGIQGIYEPFCGSAAITIACAHHGIGSSYHINDLNRPLIDLWDCILERPDELCGKYEELWEAQHSDKKAFFYRIREEFNEEHEPHKLLYLLARIVKGAVRYSNDGKFNQSADNRRAGMMPSKMKNNLLRVNSLLRGKTSSSSVGFMESVESCSTKDLIYMDPPYQGTSNKRDNRYLEGLTYDKFVSSLEELNRRELLYIISYDGRTGDKVHGKNLPSHLKLSQYEITVGRSTQDTLLGGDDLTVESLYLSEPLSEALKASPSLAKKLTTGQRDLFMLSDLDDESRASTRISKTS